MAEKIKTKSDAITLGDALRKRRKSRNITLKQISIKLRIDVGQLSRFERGEFAFISPNLQIYMDDLQIFEPTLIDKDDLIHRFSELLARSSQHLAAASHLVALLESFQPN